jgi:hypothetical protein
MLTTNETGVWANKTAYGSPKSLSGTSAWANFTWQNSSIVNTTVGWKIGCKDSAGQWNWSDVRSFDVIEPVTSYAGIPMDVNGDCIMTDEEMISVIDAWYLAPTNWEVINAVMRAAAMWWYGSKGYC